jgi:hypothetical protein
MGGWALQASGDGAGGPVGRREASGAEYQRHRRSERHHGGDEEEWRGDRHRPASPFTYRQRDRLIEAATRHGLGAVFAFPPAAREGALLAYGPDYADLYRRAGSAVDRILKGTKPADLPVEQPTKFELVINLRTAKALGITVPPSLLLQGSEIIQ